MKRIVITIDMKHDAIATNPTWEISELLSLIADRVECGGVDCLNDLTLIDSNGNTVGKSVIKTVRDKV